MKKLFLFLKSNKNVLYDILKITIPAVVDLFSQTLLSITDIMMVGKLGSNAISSVALANSPILLSIPVFISLGIGTTAIVSRAYGSNMVKKGKNCFVQSMILAVPIAVLVISILFFFGNGILNLIGQSEEIDFVLAKRYYFVAIFSLFFLVFNVVFSAGYRAIGKTEIPMCVNMSSVVLNIILNSLFIFVFKLGVLGAALATTLSTASVTLIFVIITLYKDSFISVKISDFHLDLRMMYRILRISLPVTVEQFLLRFGLLLFDVIIISLGTIAYASHKIALNAESLSFSIGFGFSFAGSALVGQELGRRNSDFAEKKALISTIMAMLIMSFLGIIFFVAPSFIVSFFNKEVEVVNLASNALKIVSVSQPFLAVTMVLGGCLRGAGDTKSPLIITILGIFLIRLPLTYLFLKVMNTGLLGAWYVMIIDLFIRSVIVYYVFRKGKWKSIKV